MISAIMFSPIMTTVIMTTHVTTSAIVPAAMHPDVPGGPVRPVAGCPDVIRTGARRYGFNNDGRCGRRAGRGINRHTDHEVEGNPSVGGQGSHTDQRGHEQCFRFHIFSFVLPHKEAV